EAKVFGLVGGAGYARWGDGQGTEGGAEQGDKQRIALFRKLDRARARNCKELRALIGEYNPRPSNSSGDWVLGKVRRTLHNPSHGGHHTCMVENP
ncbi:unnamed protein product, partial [Discosporangium mesarthrocarpum]